MYENLTESNSTYTLVVVPQKGAQTFQPINTNGSQRGYRPIVAFLPHRIRDAKILKGKNLGAVIADEFLLVPLPRNHPVVDEYRLVFQATRLERSPGEPKDG